MNTKGEDDEIEVLIVPDTEGTARTANPVNKGMITAFRIVYCFLSGIGLIVCIAFLGIFLFMYKEHRHTVYYQVGITAALFGTVTAFIAVRHSLSKTLLPGDWFMFFLLFYLGVNTVGVGMLLAKVPGALYPMVVVASMTVVCIVFTLIRCCGWYGFFSKKEKIASSASYQTNTPPVVLTDNQKGPLNMITITKKQLNEIERTNLGSDPNKKE